MNVTRFASSWRLAHSLRCVSVVSPGIQNRSLKWNRPMNRTPLLSLSLCSTAASASPTSDVESKVSKHEFQAETRQLLDIVARSLYSEKEVFIRELVCMISKGVIAQNWA